MATARERRLPQLKLTLDMPSSCSSRYPALAPIAAPKLYPSVVARHGESFRPSDLERLAILGRGNGGGTVYKVRHRATSALYALKVLHGADREPAAAVAEADIACRVVGDSPYIVRCHSVVPTTVSGDVSLLLELMDGGSLNSLVAGGGHGGLPKGAVAEVAAQALSGLAHLRSRGVVHRDVKPANLLVNRAGQVKLADFGIAAIVSGTGGEHDRAAADEGTPAYMSPERFDTERLLLQQDGDGDGDDGPYAADVWGLGVTVMELAMGRYPLLAPGQTPTWSALMWAVCFGEPPALPDSVAASPELRSFVAACLQKDHRRRATVVELLAHPFVAGRDVARSRRALREVIELRCSHK